MTDDPARPAASELQWERDGAALYPGAASSWIDRLATLFETHDRAGQRLRTLGRFAPLFEPQGEIGRLIVAPLGASARPVRAIAFDKSGPVNWALAWHQDRTICVTEQADVAGFGPWTVKQGMHHVEPPFALLERMVTVRIHIDPVDASNAPLTIALGSHRLGRISETALPSALSQLPTFACLAEAGDVWLYATPILHASDRAMPGRRRRVLQIDYSAEDLPSPLELALPGAAKVASVRD